MRTLHSVPGISLEFALIGAGWAGTDALRELLRGHPELWLPDVDEQPVFSHTQVHRQGLERTLAAHGVPRDTGRLRGTVASAYMRGWHDTTTVTTAARMAQALPGVKLVALLRDPIERARAEHGKALASGLDHRSFDDAARELLTADGLAEGRFLPDNTNAYIAQGEYGRILGEYLRWFPRASLHVELTSAFEKDPLGVLHRVLRFLGASLRLRPAHSDPAVFDRGGPSEPLADDVHDKLAAHFAADADVLRAVTGLDVPWRAEDRRSQPRRVAVCSAIAGGLDALEDPEVVSSICDYVCFTDNPYLRSNVWQIRPLELLGDDPRERTLRAKVLSHRYLPEYDASVWVDANLTLRADPIRFAERHLTHHPPLVVLDQPEGAATGVILSRRRGPVDALREAWWAKVARGTADDEAVLAAVVATHPGVRVRAGDGDRGLIRRRPHAAAKRGSFLRQEIENAHTVGLSFPKAGRTWLCYFLARYIAERTGDRMALDLLMEGTALPRTHFVHEHIDLYEDSPAPARLLNQELLMRRRIVVLVRDPRDSLISYWHQQRTRRRRPVPAKLELFADCPVFGIERISESTALLLGLHDGHPGDRLLVSYEDLVSEPDRQLHRLLRFALDRRPLDERSFRRALEASRFETMRDWERTVTPGHACGRYADQLGPPRHGALADDAYKVRRGQAGGFRTEMSPELQAHVASLPHTAALLKRLAALRASGATL